MIGYRFLSVAEDEMSEAAVFYETKTPGLGRDFLADVQQAIDRLRVYPEAGVEVADGLRSTLLRRFPFNLIYSLESNGLLSFQSHTTGDVLVTGDPARLTKRNPDESKTY